MATSQSGWTASRQVEVLGGKHDRALKEPTNLVRVRLRSDDILNALREGRAIGLELVTQ